MNAKEYNSICLILQAKCDLVPIKDEMNWEEKFERILE